MDGLHGMNHMLRTQLSELKSYLQETNKRLEFLETGSVPMSNRSRFSTYRSNDSRGSLRSGRSSHRSASVMNDARAVLGRSRALSNRQRPKTGGSWRK